MRRTHLELIMILAASVGAAGCEYYSENPSERPVVIHGTTGEETILPSSGTVSGEEGDGENGVDAVSGAEDGGGSDEIVPPPASTPPAVAAASGEAAVPEEIVEEPSAAPPPAAVHAARDRTIVPAGAVLGDGARPKPEGTIHLATIDADGFLHLCRGPSAAGAMGNSCVKLRNSRVEGQPAMLHVPDSQGGTLYVFARAATGAVLMVDCPAGDPSPERCGEYLLTGGRIVTNPSAVRMKEGTVYVFAGRSDGPIHYFRISPGWDPAVEGNWRKLRSGTLRDCGPIWESPAAVVHASGTGGEKISVFARDNDWFYGRLRVATLENPTDAVDGHRWTCRTHRDLGSMSLGSAPAVFFNEGTGSFDVFGKEHRTFRGDGYLVRWSLRPGADGGAVAMSSERLADDEMAYPWSERLALAVHENGHAGGSTHLFYRDVSGRLKHTAMENGTIETRAVAEGDGSLAELADTAPAAAVDETGMMHVFVRLKDASSGTFRHYFKTVTGPGEVWRSEGLDALVSDGSAPAVLIVPSPDMDAATADSATSTGNVLYQDDESDFSILADGGNLNRLHESSESPLVIGR